jgi:hypothetical protein
MMVYKLAKIGTIVDLAIIDYLFYKINFRFPIITYFGMQADRQEGKQTDRQTDRELDRKTGGQTDRRTDR